MKRPIGESFEKHVQMVLDAELKGLRADMLGNGDHLHPLTSEQWLEEAAQGKLLRGVVEVNLPQVRDYWLKQNDSRTMELMEDLAVDEMLAERKREAQ